MKFEHEAAHLEQFSEELSIRYEQYLLFGHKENDILHFIEFVKKENEEARHVKRCRDRVSYEDRREY